MTYDQWKTTDPRDYEPEEEQELSELEIAEEMIRELKDDLKTADSVHAARVKELESALHECLEYFEARYDVKDGDYGEQSPNEEMRLGTMVDEALHGIRF